MIRTILAVVCLIFLAFGTVKLCGCGGAQQVQGTEAALHRALDIVGATVDPISEATYRTCVDRQDAENNLVRLGKQNADEAAANNRRIRARCSDLKAVFVRVKELHDEAADLVERGLYESARERLDALLALWRELKKGGLAP